ncbi:MAG: SpoIID/LytB domain-containing protein [Clostridiales bacterium]|jgi:stage II sporulation protein D|nr:SpoIID/LytB domain-containing protein [Eubacteriales bacterium]MDH7565322.1 SpoIID/LytB domain-containing protein [Clostridiales bacterium]
MKLIKRAAAASLLVCIFAMVTMVPNAQIQIPEKIRVGLYFDSSSVSSFSVKAEKGVQIGCFKNDSFKSLVEEPSNNLLSIRKDTYYVNNNNVLKEYKPEDKNIPAGEKLGPYHVQLPGTYNDLSSVNKQAQAYKQKGVAAYPAYNDSWQLWTGFYADLKAAQADITNNLRKKIGAGEYKIISPSPTRTVISSSTGATMLVFDSVSGVLQVRPKAQNNPYLFTVNGQSYRGDLEVRRITGSDMTLINVVPLEQYLYGVVPAEIESYSHPEALKAQAVASRTYALKNLGKFKKWGFDLCNSVWDQLYKGYGVETKATNKAVDDTKGKSVVYNGNVAEVFFFASSGGMTEDAKNVFGVDIPYLKSVDDKYESAKSNHYSWEKTLTAEDIKGLMKKKGYDLGDILSVTVTKTSNAGRPVELVIKGTKGEKKFENDDCRYVFNLNSQWYSITTDVDVSVKGQGTDPVKTQLQAKKAMTSTGLKSIETTASGKGGLSVVDGSKNKKTISMVPTTYKITGKGWGHGVGMSQEGAKGMASAGFKFDQILKHYFPGTTIE